MATIRTRLISGFVLFNNTNQTLNVQLKSKAIQINSNSSVANNNTVESVDKVVETTSKTYEILNGSYSQGFHPHNFGFKNNENIEFIISCNGKILNTSVIDIFAYDTYSVACIIELLELDNILIIKYLENAYKGVCFNNNSATVANFQVYIDFKNSELPDYLFWESSSKLVSSTVNCDLSTLSLNNLIICYPSANVFWGKNSSGKPFLYSSSADTTISYTLKGTAFKTWLSPVNDIS